MTISRPLSCVCIFFASPVCRALRPGRDGLRRQRGEEYIPAVGEDDRPRAPAIARVHEQAALARVLYHTLHGRGVRRKDGNEPPVGELTGAVEARAPETVAEYRARLEQKLREVLADRTVDEARILTECAIFADRVAVDEETVRLRSHLDQLTALVNGESPVGRKMDFLIQELNRESNTIGSKCQSADIARVVVDLKSEIEKIREQIQNVE